MLKTFESLKGFIKLKNTPVSIDNLFFKLHYRATVVILLVATVLVTSRQYIGEHIKCICSGSNKAIPEHVINTYCFFTSTYTVVKHLNATYLNSGYIAHPGVGPLPQFSNEAVIRHSYYQWVPFALFAQALLFYLPHLIWKSKEGGRIKVLVVGLELASFSLHEKSYQVQNYKIPSREEKERDLNIIKKAFISNIHNKHWARWLITCEILNMIILLINIYWTDVFLGHNFFRLGPEALSRGLSSEIDILDEVFPKVTKCDFYKYGPSGSIQKFDALCVMALNIVNEKIYLILWFWFVILLVCSLIGLLWRITTWILHSRSVQFNQWVFSSTCPGKLKFSEMCTVTREAHYADWLFLYYIAKSLNGHLFNELFVSLAQDLDRDYPTLPMLDDDTSTTFSDNSLKKPSLDEVDEKPLKGVTDF